MTTAISANNRFPVWFLIVTDGIPQTMRDYLGGKRPCTIAAHNQHEYDEHYRKGWIPTQPIPQGDELKELVREYEETRKR